MAQLYVQESLKSFGEEENVFKKIERRKSLPILQQVNDVSTWVTLALPCCPSRRTGVELAPSYFRSENGSFPVGRIVQEGYCGN